MVIWCSPCLMLVGIMPPLVHMQRRCDHLFGQKFDESLTGASTGNVTQGCEVDVQPFSCGKEPITYHLNGRCSPWCMLVRSRPKIEGQKWQKVAKIKKSPKCTFSFCSFTKTLENILEHHKHALDAFFRA